MQGAPYERNWLEVRLLNRLNDRGHPVTLQDLRRLVPDMEESITCKIFDMRDEGLVSVKEIPGDHLVAISAAGQAVLTRASVIRHDGD